MNQMPVGNVQMMMNFAMVGEAVNTAHRLVDLAEDGQVVFSAGIATQLNKNDEMGLSGQSIHSLGYKALKGKSKPEALFCIESERTPLVEK